MGQLHDMYFIFHLRNKLINDKIFCSVSFTFFEYFEGKYKKNALPLLIHTGLNSCNECTHK